MQKISTYLYPNRVFVVADLGDFQTEWRIVYQRTIKLYQGIDNIIEVDVKNAQQRRIDIASFNLVFVLFNMENQKIFETSVETNTGIKGIGRILMPKEAFFGITPQFLKYSLYKVENDSSTLIPMYGDTQFGFQGKCELIGGVMPEENVTLYIDGGDSNSDFTNGQEYDGGAA